MTFNPLRTKRFVLGLVFLLAFSAVVGLVLYGLKQNINAYYLPSELRVAALPPHVPFRLGGLVKKNSLLKEKKGLMLCFTVTDSQEEQRVCYEGLLPDLFREGQGVIVEGSLNEKGVMEGKRVLAKHDENYRPPHLNEKIKGPL